MRMSVRAYVTVSPSRWSMEFEISAEAVVRSLVRGWTSVPETLNDHASIDQSQTSFLNRLSMVVMVNDLRSRLVQADVRRAHAL